MNQRMKSFVYAWSGIVCFFRTEFNARIHLLATVLVIGLGFLFELSYVQWALISLAIGLVFISEMINTTIECLVDEVSPDYCEMAGKIKDIAAGAVLVASIVAVAIAACVFLPKLYPIIQF